MVRVAVVLALALSGCASYSALPSPPGDRGLWVVRSRSFLWVPMGSDLFWCDPSRRMLDVTHNHRWCAEAGLHEYHSGMGLAVQAEPER